MYMPAFWTRPGISSVVDMKSFTLATMNKMKSSNSSTSHNLSAVWGWERLTAASTHLFTDTCEPNLYIIGLILRELRRTRSNAKIKKVKWVLARIRWKWQQRVTCMAPRDALVLERSISLWEGRRRPGARSSGTCIGISTQRNFMIAGVRRYKCSWLQCNTKMGEKNKVSTAAFRKVSQKHKLYFSFIFPPIAINIYGW